jgi:hypothetical protein
MYLQSMDYTGSGIKVRRRREPHARTRFMRVADKMARETNLSAHARRGERSTATSEFWTRDRE